MGGRFSENDLLLDQETTELQNMSRTSFQKQLQSLENGISQPKENKKSLHNHGGLVLVKAIPDDSPTLTATWEGPNSVIRSSPTAGKVTGIDAWIPHTQIKPWNSPGENHKDHLTPPEENSQENSQCLEYQYPLLEGLKGQLFKKGPGYEKSILANG